MSTGSLCPLPQAASSATVQNRAGNRWLLWKMGVFHGPRCWCTAIGIDELINSADGLLSSVDVTSSCVAGV